MARRSAHIRVVVATMAVGTLAVTGWWLATVWQIVSAARAIPPGGTLPAKEPGELLYALEHGALVSGDSDNVTGFPESAGSRYTSPDGRIFTMVFIRPRRAMSSCIRRIERSLLPVPGQPARATRRNVGTSVIVSSS